MFMAFFMSEILNQEPISIGDESRKTVTLKTQEILPILKGLNKATIDDILQEVKIEVYCNFIYLSNLP